MTFGSLFAGIGGMDLGLERAGMCCVWQVEIDPFCRRVLEKHWPDARRWDDVRTFPPGDPDDWRCDLIAGGFPCQNVSNAGRRSGISGERSGLWTEYARIIRLLRPRFVLVENVSGLLVRGLGRVLGDLAAIGYDAEWSCIQAAHVGAPQRRERVWILAYPDDAGLEGPIWTGKPLAAGPEGTTPHRQSLRSDRGSWPPGPRAVGDIPRVAHGPADRMDRLRGLGNAVVPQVAELIGRLIMEATDGTR